MDKNILLKTNLFICGIIIVGFIITSFVSYHSNRGMFNKDVENVTSLTSEGIYYQIDSIFTKPINISLTMANDSLLKEFLTEETARGNDSEFIQTMRDYLLAYRDKYNYDSVFLVSTKTNRYYHFEGLDRVLTPDNQENVWYYTFLESEDECSLNIDNDEAAQNEITVFINCKIKDPDGNVMGIVGVGFRVDYLQNIFRDYETKFDLDAYLVDNEGMIQISTDTTGYESEDLFSHSSYTELKDTILSEKDKVQSFWYSSGLEKGYLISRYIPNMNWHLLIEKDTSAFEQRFGIQLSIGILIVVLVIGAVLFTITTIIRRYNRQIIQLTLKRENEYQSVFQRETAKMYENIYEIDITNNRAASEATEKYFESLGVPEKTPYDKALVVIADKQIKEEFRKGYLDTFSPYNVLRAYHEGRENPSYDFMITVDGGCSYYWIRITTRIFYWKEDQSIRMFIYRQNIDEQRRHEEKMVEKMRQDSLTGLLNKATTQESIQLLLNKNPDDEFAFFIIDIDNFKRVNDTFGHAMGDLVIADFSSILKNQFREEDVVGRIGGDEFAVFVPSYSQDWVIRKAHLLVSALHHTFSDGNKKCRLSASIGVAISPEAGSDFETLYRNADSALYRTKKSGKDGYTLYCGSGKFFDGGHG